MLICEEMNDDESILITGAEQFTAHTGYGGSFKCKGPTEDTNSIDERNRRKVNIVAMDATLVDDLTNQFTKPSIIRELNKAYSGFSHTLSDDRPSENKMTMVATGNWGCGAFGGHKHLKMLIQWMAASRVGRPVKYHTFREPELTKELVKVTTALLQQKVTVAQLYKILVLEEDALKDNVFKYVLDSVHKN